MKLQTIIATAADEADEFLSGISAPKDARAPIAEWLGENHPELSPPERKQVTDGLLALLVREGFFEATAGMDPTDTEGLESGAAE